jgi:two-component system, sensor histidine kinase and response regulator
LEKLGGDEGLLCEVVRIFLQDTPRQLATLRHAIDEANTEEVEKIAHNLKGEMGYLGISDLSEKAYQLELSGREGDMIVAGKLFAAFEYEISRVVAAMRSLQNLKGDAPATEQYS